MVFDNGRPSVTLAEVGAELPCMRIAPLGEGNTQASASVEALLDRACDRLVQVAATLS